MHTLAYFSTIIEALQAVGRIVGLVEGYGVYYRHLKSFSSSIASKNKECKWRALY